MPHSDTTTIGSASFATCPPTLVVCLPDASGFLPEEAFEHLQLKLGETIDNIHYLRLTKNSLAPKTIHLDFCSRSVAHATTRDTSNPLIKRVSKIFECCYSEVDDKNATEQYVRFIKEVRIVIVAPSFADLTAPLVANFLAAIGIQHINIIKLDPLSEIYKDLTPDNTMLAGKIARALNDSIFGYVRVAFPSVGALERDGKEFTASDILAGLDKDSEHERKLIEKMSRLFENLSTYYTKLQRESLATYLNSMLSMMLWGRNKPVLMIAHIQEHKIFSEEMAVPFDLHAEVIADITHRALIGYGSDRYSCGLRFPKGVLRLTKALCENGLPTSSDERDEERGSDSLLSSKPEEPIDFIPNLSDSPRSRYSHSPYCFFTPSPVHSVGYSSTASPPMGDRKQPFKSLAFKNLRE